MRINSFRKRATALVVTFIYSATNIVLASSAQTNLWKERQKTIQLAALPAVQSQLTPSGLLPSHPTPPFRLKKHSRYAANAPLAAILESIPQNLGTVRKVLNPSKTSRQIVIHIQDVHQNPEAQQNIEKTVQALINQKSVSLLAMEGAFGPIDIKNFRNFPDQQSVRDVVDYYKAQNQITGPMVAAFTSPVAIPTLVGIDHQKHYDANVQAYLASRFQKKSVVNILASELSALNIAKQKTFNPELLTFDSQVTAYHQEKLSMGDFVVLLGQKADEVSLNVEMFLQALQIERRLDFKRVEREREQVLTQLTNKLSSDALSDLMALSVAYRLGELSHAEFYAHLQNLCIEQGIILKKYPALDAYVKYMSFSNAIDAEGLTNELSELESKVYASLAKSSKEEELIEASRRLILKNKISEYSLSPTEWQEYKKANLYNDEYERFYREAEARDHAMAENLLTQLKKTRSNVSVLVTGGFHSPGIDKALAEKGITVVSFTPRITKVGEGGESKYLSVFAQEKTPLEKLFEGERLFVSPPIRPDAALMGVAVSAQAAIRSTDPNATFRLSFFKLFPGLSGRLKIGIEKVGKALLVTINNLGTRFAFSNVGKLASVRSEKIVTLTPRLLLGASFGAVLFLGLVFLIGEVPFPLKSSKIVGIVSLVFLMTMGMVSGGTNLPLHRLASDVDPRGRPSWSKAAILRYAQVQIPTILNENPNIRANGPTENDRAAFQKLLDLNSEILEGRPIQLLSVNVEGAAIWNQRMAPYVARGWLGDIPIALAESYFYQRVLEACGYFQPKALNPYYPIKRKEIRDAVARFSQRLERLKELEGGGPVPNHRAVLSAIVDGILAGNKFDLTKKIDAGLTLVTDEREAILDELLSGTKNRMDIIADNVGDELLLEMFLASYLLKHRLAKRVYLHLKKHPYFVSDSTLQDLNATLGHMSHGQPEIVAQFFKEWHRYQVIKNVGGAPRDAKWTGFLTEEHDFWTSGLPFSEMPTDLKDELRESDLVMAVGDLNQRRFLSDRRWDPSTSLREVGSNFPAPIAFVRMIKNDIFAGVNLERVKRLRAQAQDWFLHGTHGVVQFFNPRPSPSEIPASLVKGQLRAMASQLQSFQLYQMESVSNFALSRHAKHLMKNEIDFRRTVLDRMVKGTPLFDFVMGLRVSQGQAVDVSWVSFNVIWHNLLQNDPDLRQREKMGSLSFSDQLDLVLASDEAKGQWQEKLKVPLIVKDVDQYVVEDRVLKDGLDRNEVSAPLIYDRGRGNGAATIGIRASTLGRVVAQFTPNVEYNTNTPLILVHERGNSPYIQSKPVAEFLKGDVLGPIQPDLVGKISVLRDADLLSSLTNAEHRQVVANAFRYAEGNPKGMFYHQTRGTWDHPTLFRQMIFKLKSSQPDDWELVHVGVLGQSTGEDRSSYVSNSTAFEKEGEVARLVIEIRQKLLRTPNFDLGSGQDERTNLLRHIAQDILAISPWSPDANFHGEYYEAHSVHSSCALVWRSLHKKQDIIELLTDLRSRLNSGEKGSTLTPLLLLVTTAVAIVTGHFGLLIIMGIFVALFIGTGMNMIPGGSRKKGDGDPIDVLQRLIRGKLKNGHKYSPDLLDREVIGRMASVITPWFQEHRQEIMDIVAKMKSPTRVLYQNTSGQPFTIFLRRYEKKGPILEDKTRPGILLPLSEGMRESLFEIEKDVASHWFHLELKETRPLKAGQAVELPRERNIAYRSLGEGVAIEIYFPKETDQIFRYVAHASGDNQYTRFPVGAKEWPYFYKDVPRRSKWKQIAIQDIDAILKRVDDQPVMTTLDSALSALDVPELMRQFPQSYLYQDERGRFLFKIRGDPAALRRYLASANFKFTWKNVPAPYHSLISFLTRSLHEYGIPTDARQQEKFVIRTQDTIQNWFDKNREALQQLQTTLNNPDGEEGYRRNLIFAGEGFAIVNHRFAHGTPIHDHAGSLAFVIPVEDGMSEEPFDVESTDSEWVSIKAQDTTPMMAGKVTSLTSARGAHHQLKGKGGVIEIYIGHPVLQVSRFVPHVNDDGHYLRHPVLTSELPHRVQDLVKQKDWQVLDGDEKTTALTNAKHTFVYLAAGAAVQTNAIQDAFKKFPKSILHRHVDGRLLLELRGDALQIKKYWARVKLATTQNYDRNVVKTEIKDGVAVITLNRPDKLNAINWDMKVALYQTIESLEKNPDVKAIVLTGEGKAFVAGGDLAALKAHQDAATDATDLVLPTQLLFRRIENCTKPVIAAINGLAYGGGNELAMSAHYRVAVESAKFAQTEIRLGIIPGAGGTQRLVRLVGVENALAMNLSGADVTSTQALEIGLVDELIIQDPVARAVYVAHELIEQKKLLPRRTNSTDVQRWANEIPHHFQVIEVPEKGEAADAIIEAIRQGAKNLWSEAGEDGEALLYAKTVQTTAAKKRVSGFLNKTFAPKAVGALPALTPPLLARLPILGPVNYQVSYKRSLADVTLLLEARFGDVDFSKGISEEQMHELNQILASLDVTDPELQKKLVLKEGALMAAVGLLPKNFRNAGLVLWAAGYSKGGSSGIHAHDSPEYVYEAFVPAVGENKTDTYAMAESKNRGGQKYVRLARVGTVTQFPNSGSVYVEQRSQAIHTNYNPTDNPSWVVLLYVRTNVKAPLTAKYLPVNEDEQSKLRAIGSKPWYRYQPPIKPIPERVVQGMEKNLRSLRHYFTQAKRLAQANKGPMAISAEAHEIYLNTLLLRRVVLEGLNKPTLIHWFMEDVVAIAAVSVPIDWAAFDNVWNKLLRWRGQVSLKWRHEQNPFSLEEQVGFVLQNKTSREEWKRQLTRQVAATSSGRFAIEDQVLKRLAKDLGMSNLVALDRGASTGVTSHELQVTLDADVIAVDKNKTHAPYLDPLQLARGQTQREWPLQNSRLKFLQADFTKKDMSDLDGKISVVRDAGVRIYLSPEELKKAVGDVFRYAAAAPKGVLYHMTQGSVTRPTLFSQLVFYINGPKPTDWELKYVGFLNHMGGKNPSFYFKAEDMGVAESHLSGKVMRVRNALLRYIDEAGYKDYLDEYGRVKAEIIADVIAGLLGEGKGVEHEAQARIINDLLLISPWTREAELTGNFYEANSVMVPYELGWEFAEPKRDLYSLLWSLEDKISNRLHPYDNAPQLGSSPNSHSGKNFIRDAYSEQFLILPVTLLSILPFALSANANYLWLLGASLFDIAVFWPMRFLFVKWHKDEAREAATRVLRRYRGRFSEDMFRIGLRGDFKRYYKLTFGIYFVLVNILMWAFPCLGRMDIALKMLIAYVPAYLWTASKHAKRNIKIFSSLDHRSDEEIVAGAVVAAAVMTANGIKNGRPINQVIGDAAELQLGVIRRQDGSLVQETVDMAKLVIAIEKKMEYALADKSIDFPTAQRLVNEMSKWIGTPIEMDEHKNVVVFARKKDMEGLKKVLSLPADRYEIEIVVDAAEFIEIEAHIKALAKRPYRITQLGDLFPSESELTRWKFESHLTSLIQRSQEQKWLLIYSKELAFRLDEMAVLKDEALAMFDYVSLEEFVSSSLERIKIMPLNHLINLSKALSRNA